MAGRNHERLPGKGPRTQVVIPSWTTLGDDDRRAYWSAVDFLKSRLTESDTIEWALRLRPDQRIERMAISNLLDSTTGPVLEEMQEVHWAAAWRLIQENWSQDSIEEHYSSHIFDIGLRLHRGDRSGPIVTAIVNLVAPRLKVEPVDSFTWNFIKKPRRPKTLAHLLSASLTSGRLLNLNDLGLPKLTDMSFLVVLANALDATVNHGLDMARRTGWGRCVESLEVGFDVPSPIRAVSTRRQRAKRIRHRPSRDLPLGQAPACDRGSHSPTGAGVGPTVRSAVAPCRVPDSHSIVVGTDTEPIDPFLRRKSRNSSLDWTNASFGNCMNFRKSLNFGHCVLGI